ncbi:hypothetical protein ZWY2020_039838 [Hordeum vulgare]|nr:hypothetical protein ZWY2020_039838 [Hordeum vulgare]
MESGQIGSKSSTSPKNGEVVNSSKQNLADCVPHSAISCSVLKRDDVESRPGDTEVEKLSVGVTSVTLDSKDTVHSMAENQQLGAVPSTSVVVPLSQSLNKEQSHLKLAGLSSSENKDCISCQSSSDKHLDWSSELQSCRVASPSNDIWNSSVATDKPHATANTSHISLWNDKEINPTSTSDGRTSGTMLQTRLSSTDNASTLLNGRREGLGPMYTPDMVSEHSGMRNHQHRALDAARNDNIGSFGNAASGNKDEGSIISDILSLEFDPWDESYSTANNFVKMLNESEKNDALFNAPSWKSKGTSNESRFSFARQDNQRNFQDSSFRNCGSDQNFSLLSQNSHGNSYQNGVAFQSLEEDFSKSNHLAMSDIATAGSSRSKISAPPGFAAPARDGSNNIPPGFSSFSGGFSSQNGSNQAYGSTFSETRLLDNLFGSHTNQYQPQISRHTSDIEFIDPAILAVGKGRMPVVGDSGLDLKNTPFPAQLQTSNNDPRLQLLMQQSMPSHQNLRYTDHVQDAFNPIQNDNYLASRLLPQNHGSLSPYAQMSLQQPRNSQLANGHWDGWSDLRQGNNVPMSDMSRMLYPTEANNFHMLGSNDISTGRQLMQMGRHDPEFELYLPSTRFLSRLSQYMKQVVLEVYGSWLEKGDND